MALLTAFTIMTTGCAGSEEIVKEQPSKSQGNTITMTTTVSLDDGDATRALNPSTGKKTFAVGEKITVAYIAEDDGKVYYAESDALTATDISEDGHHATFTVWFYGYPYPAANGKMRVIYPSGMAAITYNNEDPYDDSKTINSSKLAHSQNGTISVLSQSHDLATFDGTMTDGSMLPDKIPLSNRLAILELTVKEESTVINGSLKQLFINDGTNTYTVGDGTSTTFPDPMYVAVWPFADKPLTITATDGTNHYAKIVSSATLERNTINPVRLTMTKKTPRNLSALTAADLEADGKTFIAQNGDVLTGEIDGSTKKIKVMIAAGATVTLSNATIDGKTGDTSAPWAGITCEGDATILLAGTNKVTNFDVDYPAIYIAPGKTLTIGGTGLLTASNTFYDTTGWGAGIGGGYDMDCGNIVIVGGFITANGGKACAGIGASDATCGDIIIIGGTVTATADSEGGAGIGCGRGVFGDALCGKITISGPAIVTATGGGNGAGIGSGSKIEGNALCGDITISGACTVTATGGGNGVGIGSGCEAKCGDITITGGIVRAQGNGNSTGIGNGNGNSTCGDITIESGEGFTSVTAIKGPDAFKPIGCSSTSEDKYCGTIKFGGGEIYQYRPYAPPFMIYNTGASGLNLEETTTNLGGDADYTNNTWVLTPRTQ